jgi:hypothetical protein
MSRKNAAASPSFYTRSFDIRACQISESRRPAFDIVDGLEKALGCGSVKGFAGGP